jgi:hypothetical protein
MIAAISGTTMQVQNQQSGQVAVTWTGATKFSHMVSVPVSSITVGSCVTAVGGSGTSRSASSFTAATLIVSTPRTGSCSGGFGGGTGQRPSGFPSGGGRPSGFPSGGGRPSGFPGGARPSGFPSGGAAPSGRPQLGAIANGKVTAVSGSSLTIAAQPAGSASTTTKTVTVGSQTKITTQAATNAKSLAIGKCVAAAGKADSTGTVTATTVQISDPTNGQCGSGFGRRGGTGG